MAAPAVQLAELPLLAQFYDVARDVIPVDFGGDAPPEMFPGEFPGNGDVWYRKSMARWFRKIVALDHASEGYGGVLIWLDCDCISTAPLPLSTLQSAFDGAGLAYMKAKRKYPETGIVGYDLAVPGVRDLLGAMKEHYLARAFERYPRWDDCITLELTRRRRGAPRSHDMATRSVDGEVLPYTVLAQYFHHDKGLHSRKLGLLK